MSDDLIQSGQELMSWLRTRLKDTRRLSIATGPLSESGLGALLTAIRPRLESGELTLRLLYGHLAEGSANLRALQQLRHIDREHGGRVFIRVARRPRGALFNPRIFLLDRSGERLSSLVGSAPLTGSGLGQNVELCLGRDHPWGDADPLAKLFETWWYRSDLLPAPEAPSQIASGPVLARLLRAAERGVIAQWEVRWGGLTLRLSDRVLGDGAPASLQQGLLHLNPDAALEVQLAPSGARARLRSLEAWGRKQLGAISLRSPWGRLVTESCLPHLRGTLPDFAGRIQEDTAPIRAALESPVPEFEHHLREDLEQLLRRVAPERLAAEPLLIDAEVRRALQERERRLTRGPPPWRARLRLAPVQIPRGPRLGPPGLEPALGRSSDEDLRQLVITAADAPRRSLLKYRTPDRALQLCLLPDPHLQDAALSHAWRGARLQSGDQFGLFRDRTPEVHAKLQGQVAAIHTWYDLPLPEVLDRYRGLLEGEEP